MRSGQETLSVRGLLTVSRAQMPAEFLAVWLWRGNQNMWRAEATGTDLGERAQNAYPAERVKAKDRSSENMTDMMETRLF